MLDVPLLPQKTNMWCWAASGEMIMAYLGADIAQCKQANERFGRTDCCDTPTPAKCIEGGTADFEHWYFDFDVAQGALTFQHLKDEIDAGRPVHWAKSWEGGGGHVLVATGYKETDGKRYVRVNDPWEPNEGDQYWLSYSEYLRIPGEYEHQNDFWHIKENRQCYTDFHELSSSRMQDCFDYQRQRGRYLETFSANRQSSSSVTMQGSWRSGSNSPYVRFNLSSSAYQAAFDEYAEKGYRPKQVTATAGSSGPLYTAIFVNANNAFRSTHRQTLAQFDADFADLRNSHDLADFSVYDDDGELRVAATWVQSSTSFKVRYGMTSAQFEDHFDTYKADGFQVTRFDAYETDAGVRYAALWHPADGAWAMYYGMSSAQYQSRHEQMTADGYHLTNITALNNVYAAVWSK